MHITLKIIINPNYMPILLNGWLINSMMPVNLKSSFFKWMFKQENKNLVMILVSNKEHHKENEYDKASRKSNPILWRLKQKKYTEKSAPLLSHIFNLHITGVFVQTLNVFLCDCRLKWTVCKILGKTIKVGVPYVLLEFLCLTLSELHPFKV